MKIVGKYCTNFGEKNGFTVLFTKSNFKGVVCLSNISSTLLGVWEMSTLAQVLRANSEFMNSKSIQRIHENSHSVSKFPNRHLAIFTCMDTRLVEFLEPAMGIKRGEVKVIKNAGNSITGPFASTIRSLVVSIFELGVKEIMIIGHLDCGIAHSTSRELIQKMLSRGISLDAIRMVEEELELWLDQFQNPIDNVKRVVYKIRCNPLIPKDIPVHGLIFNPNTGAINVVIDGYKSKTEEYIDIHIVSWERN